MWWYVVAGILASLWGYARAVGIKPLVYTIGVREIERTKEKVVDCMCMIGCT